MYAGVLGHAFILIASYIHSYRCTVRSQARSKNRFRTRLGSRLTNFENLMPNILWVNLKAVYCYVGYWRPLSTHVVKMGGDMGQDPATEVIWLNQPPYSFTCNWYPCHTFSFQFIYHCKKDEHSFEPNMVTLVTFFYIIARFH